MRSRAWLAWWLVGLASSFCSANKSELFFPAPSSEVGVASIGSASTSEDVLSAARDALTTRLPPNWVGDIYSEEDNCWAVLSVWPERKCVRKSNTCAVPTIAQADSCRFCARGYGVYRTEEDCLKAPEAEGEGEASVSSASIDPWKYHQPEVAGSQCWTTRSKTSQDPCPHLWPDVRLWEDAATWPNSRVPPAWSAVTLPENTKVLISGCSLSHQDPFFSINIPSSSELIFADAPLHLRVGSIYVNGRMRIGSPSCRVWHPITITFEKLQGLNTFEMGIKVSQSGQLDLHGREFFPTWTRLSETAQQWSNFVKLPEPVNWQPGQLVTIATSIWRDEFQNQNEVMRVSSISDDGRTVTFDDSLQFSHYGGVEYKTEVALLSRSILLRGHDRAQDEKKGGHVRIEGQGRIRGVLAYKMGQRNTIGAYPFHFHHLGFVESGSSYISDSAVYNSFYRGVVIHGTSGLLVKGNVAFHVDGNCFYLEDGVEENNWLEGNFAGFIHTIGAPAGGNDQTGSLHIQGEGLEQPADAAASGFYSGNPNNVWLRNAASGGFAGFSFPTLPKPINDFRWRNDFVPLQRPLQRFEGNTVHSTGYFWLMSGGIYFGGQLWHNDNDGGKLYYSSGRFESDPKTEDGTQESTHVLRYNKAWLAQWGVSHWGDRVTVEGWEADDCTRGANLFGMAKLNYARINGRSSNKDAQYPGRLTDLAPIAGFQWYDARVMTILSDVTFRNYFYQPQLGASRQSVWHSMVHSDEFKPQHMSTSINIRYENIDWRALVNHPAVSTGGSRYFQWVDWDGSASKRWRPTVFGSWPSWWNAGDECSFQQEWNVWLCDWYPWRTPARLDIRVPGYTSRVDTNSALPPTPENEAGYIAQFGYRYDKKRSVAFTRNEGSVGLTGKGGWYVHFKHGVPRKISIFPNQIPPGTSLVFATRYPQGTTFNIRRWFKWQGKYTSNLRWTSSLQEVLDSPTGELFYFNGKHLFIKITDPDARVQRPLKLNGAIVWGARYFELAYDIEATNLDDASCPWKQGARFCQMQEDEGSDIPDFLPSYTSWLEPYCADVPPPGGSSCQDQASWGKCNDNFMTSPGDTDAQALGSYCAVTCGRCTEGEFSCADRAPPGSLSGGKSCPQLKEDCACFQWWMEEGNFCATTCGFGKCADKSSPSDGGCGDIVPAGGSSCEEQRCYGKCYDDWMYRGDYCQNTCGRCNECRDLQPNSGYSCAQHRDWGDCSKSWMKDGRLCEATCCVCGGCTLEPVCSDKEPSGGVSCWQRKEWGSCSEQWMKDGGYCKKTCGFDPCPPVCDDIEPAGGVRCWQRKEWGNCNDQWMKDGGYCKKTCGFDPCPPVCNDIEPPGGASCWQRKEWGNCDDQWMKDAGYCRRTCGLDPCPPVCNDNEPPGGVSCWQRREWGNCDDQWMRDGSYCARTCGFWPCPVCDDVQPSGDTSCWQRKEWGNCDDQWMKDGHYCAKTCGYFPCPAA